MSDKRKRLPFKPISDSKINDEIGLSKIPPQAIDMEEVVLGAIIIVDSPKTKKVANLIEPKHFYKETHVIICQAIKEMMEKSQPIDILTIVHKLKSMKKMDEIGGIAYLHEITNRAVSDANIDYHFHIVLQMWMRREVINISLEHVQIAYDEGCDSFELIDEMSEKLDRLAPERLKIFSVDAKKLGEDYMEVMEAEKGTSGSLQFYYETGWKNFDQYVSIGRDKVLLISGPAGHGKTKFVSSLAFRLLEKYHEDTSVYWVTLEDSAMDVIGGYVSSQIYVKNKHLKQKKYDQSLIPTVKHHVEQVKKYDIQFTERSIQSKDIVRNFEIFCEDRKGRFNILIVDNILSLADRDKYGRDLNSMYDYVMQKMLECRQRTNGLIIILHHFRDAQMDKNNRATGYRSTVVDIKGTEAFRRVPNQVLMINKPELYKDLLAEYSDEHLEVLRHMFIVDTGKNREDKNNDLHGVIYYFAELDYNNFEEIEILDVPEDSEKENEDKHGRIVIV